MDIELEKQLVSITVCEVEKPFILRSRNFRRTVSHGMKVWRGTTRNFDTGTEVEHIEMACPHMVWSDRGPIWKRKSNDDE